METLNVTLVIEWHPNSVGGVQTHVRDLASKLSKTGFNVIIVSRRVGLGDVAFQEAEGYHTVNSLIPVDILMVPPDPRDLEEALREAKPDVVHSHHIFTLTPLMALKVAHDMNIGRLATNHTIFLAYDFRLLWNTVSIVLPTRYYLQYAQAVISISKAADTFVESIMGSEFPARRYVIPNGVDVERFKPPTREPDEDSILFIGRLVYRKGLHVLIEAFSRIADNRDATLYVAGGGYMEIPSKILAKAYGVDDKVKFLGVVPESEKPKIYGKAKIVVVPSLFNESFGITALEAMASGRPLIATKVGGLEELVKHGKTGILVNPGSPDELADAIEMLLDDKNLRSRLGENARREAELEYSWDVVINKIINVYKTITGG